MWEKNVRSSYFPHFPKCSPSRTILLLLFVFNCPHEPYLQREKYTHISRDINSNWNQLICARKFCATNNIIFFKLIYLMHYFCHTRINSCDTTYHVTVAQLFLSHFSQNVSSWTRIIYFLLSVASLSMLSKRRWKWIAHDCVSYFMSVMTLPFSLRFKTYFTLHSHILYHNKQQHYDFKFTQSLASLLLISFLARICHYISKIGITKKNWIKSF